MEHHHHQQPALSPNPDTDPLTNFTEISHATHSPPPDFPNPPDPEMEQASDDKNKSVSTTDQVENSAQSNPTKKRQRKVYYPTESQRRCLRTREPNKSYADNDDLDAVLKEVEKSQRKDWYKQTRAIEKKEKHGNVNPKPRGIGGGGKKKDDNGNEIISVMCHQCQRNDKGRVVRCSKCKTKRYCEPCITRWLPFSALSSYLMLLCVSLKNS